MRSLHSMSDAELLDRFDELERSARAIEAERARCLAEIERRGMHAADGQLSAAAWVARRHGIPQGVAESRVRTARALEEMPRVAGALARGEISTAAADALARARERAPEAFGPPKPSWSSRPARSPIGPFEPSSIGGDRASTQTRTIGWPGGGSPRW